MPCHDDLLAANLLGDGKRVWLVDWEYAGMGDRYFDLGNLSINNGFGEDDDRALLDAYWDEPCTDRRFAALRLMRVDVRRARGDVGRRSSRDHRAGLRLRRLRRRAPRAPGRATIADPRFEGWLRDAATP